MEKLAADVNRFLSNEMRLQQITAENNILLQRTKQLETKMNRLKQQGETPCKKDESVLNAMVSKSLYLLAEVHTLQTVGTLLVPQRSLQTMTRNRYNQLMDRFRQRLYYKRQQRTKNLKRLHHLDFKIWQ